MLCRCIRTPLQNRNTDVGLKLLQNFLVSIFFLKGFGKCVCSCLWIFQKILSFEKLCKNSKFKTWNPIEISTFFCFVELVPSAFQKKKKKKIIPCFVRETQVFGFVQKKAQKRGFLTTKQNKAKLTRKLWFYRLLMVFIAAMPESRRSC